MTWRPGDVKATGGIITTSGTTVELAEQRVNIRIQPTSLSSADDLERTIRAGLLSIADIRRIEGMHPHGPADRNPMPRFSLRRWLHR